MLSVMSMNFVLSITFIEAFCHIYLNPFCKVPQFSSTISAENVKSMQIVLKCVALYQHLQVFKCHSVLQSAVLTLALASFLVQAPKNCQWKYLP